MKTTLFFLAFLLAPRLFGDPSITAGGIVNATGYQTKLAPDTVFVIFGSGLGSGTIATSGAPYPPTLGGTSITFTAASGGAVIAAKMVYSLATQVSGLLPSSIAPGTYAVRVTYNNVTSPPQNVTVVARSFGIAAANSGGSGTAQSTIGNVNGGLSLTRFTGGSVAFGGFNWTLGPAHPGDVLVLWGTGGGADAANDTGGTSGDQTKAGNFIVSVGGRAITPDYAGASSGYPGLWQINFTLPADIAPDCFAYTQVSAGGELSNAVTIPIAAPGQTVCSTAGFTSTTLAKLDGGGNIVFAGMTAGRIVLDSGPLEVIGGPFNRFSVAKWLAPYSGPKFGPCIVIDISYTGTFPLAPDALLDAGAKLTLSGGTVPVTVGQIPGPVGAVYSVTVPNGTLVGGTKYTLTGTGGTQVGAFTASATLPNSFTLGTLGVIDRTKAYPLTWSGTGFDTVIIQLNGTITGTPTHQVVVSCEVPGGPGAFSIPAGALAYLPAVGPGVPGSVGQISVSASVADPGAVSSQSSSATTLTPPLVGGGQVDFGSFSAYLAVVKSVVVQ